MTKRHGGMNELTRRDALRLGAAGLGALAVPSFLAACGGGGGTSGGGNGGNASGGGPSSGTVVFQGWDYMSQLVQQNIDHFQQLNPKIKVKYTPVISAQYVSKMDAEFSAGAQPDAMYVYDDSLAGWVDAGYLQPIDGLPGVDKVYNAIYKGNAQAMSYKGKRYGLPYYTDCMCLTYVDDILQKAGISTPAKSLDEFTQQCLKIKQSGVVKYPIGIVMGVSDLWASWWWGLLFASNAKLFDDKLNPVMHKDKNTLQVLTWLHEALNKTKILDPASLQRQSTSNDLPFMAGTYAFTIGARYGLRALNNPAQAKIAGHAKMAWIPNLNGKLEGTVSNSRMYCLSKTTKVRDMAFKLMSYLGGFDKSGQPYTAKFWFEKEGLGFAFKQLAKDPQIQAQLKQFADPTVYEQLAEVARPRRVIIEPWYSQFERKMQQLVQQVLINQMSPAAGLKAMADEAGTLKKQYS